MLCFFFFCFVFSGFSDFLKMAKRDFTGFFSGFSAVFSGVSAFLKRVKSDFIDFFSSGIFLNVLR